MTVLEVLQATSAYLKKHNVENSRLNAEHLMAHALDRKRIELYLDFERELTEAELGPLRKLVKRRSTGELHRIDWLDAKFRRLRGGRTGPDDHGFHRAEGAFLPACVASRSRSRICRRYHLHYHGS